MLDRFILDALRLAGRPLSVGELAGLRFGEPSEAQRKQVKRAVDGLAGGRRVVAGLRLVPDVRGVKREQLVVELAGGPALSPAVTVPAAPAAAGVALEFNAVDWLELGDPVEPPAEYFGHEDAWHRWEAATNRAWRRHQQAVAASREAGGGGLAAAAATPDEPFDPAEFATG